MRFYTILFAVSSLLLLSGCDKLGAAFEDIQEEAPGVCKDMCEDEIDCEWDAYDVGGSEEDAARADSIDLCVVECAFQINNGIYVGEYDDDDLELVGTISGGAWQKYLDCLYELYDCDDDSFGFELDDDDNCELYAKCYEHLGIETEYRWIDNCDDLCDWLGNEDEWEEACDADMCEYVNDEDIEGCYSLGDQFPVSGY